MHTLGPMHSQPKKRHVVSTFQAIAIATTTYRTRHEKSMYIV